MKNDTINLLLECNSGIKMGENAIDNLLPHVKNQELKRILQTGKSTHANIGDETQKLLQNHGVNTKDLHPIARAMSNMKIYTTMIIKEDDHSIANLMTDGCDMGIKSLSKFLNKYDKADDKAKSIAKKLIASEEYLESKMRAYL